MLVEAAWSAIKTPGPLRAFYQRIRARRGAQIAIVAIARKLASLCWHLLITDQDYAFKRQTLVDRKLRALELRAGAPTRHGIQRQPEPDRQATLPSSNESSSNKPNSPTNASSKTGKPPATR